MRSSFLTRHSQNAVLASLIASMFATAVAIGTAGYTFYSNKIAQDREARLEQIAKFDQTTQAIIDAAQSFVAAINDRKGLISARTKLQTVVASEIHNTDDVARFFDERVRQNAQRYQTALEELNDVSQHTAEVTEMRVWAETFGKVLDAKSALSGSLYSELGMKTNPIPSG